MESLQGKDKARTGMNWIHVGFSFGTLKCMFSSNRALHFSKSLLLMDSAESLWRENTSEGWQDEIYE